MVSIVRRELPGFPSEAYWPDADNHFVGVTGIDQARAHMREWFGGMDASRLGQSVMIIQGRGALRAAV